MKFTSQTQTREDPSEEGPTFTCNVNNFLGFHESGETEKIRF
jgi:hypothetical protein